MTVTAGVNSSGAGTLVNEHDFTISGSGSLTVGASARILVSDFQSSGVLTLTPGTGAALATRMTNSGTSRLVVQRAAAGRSSATPQTAGQNLAILNLNGQNAIVAGGLFVNNGFVGDGCRHHHQVIADFGCAGQRGGHLRRPGRSPRTAASSRPATARARRDLRQLRLRPRRRRQLRLRHRQRDGRGRAEPGCQRTGERLGAGQGRPGHRPAGTGRPAATSPGRPTRRHKVDGGVWTRWSTRRRWASTCRADGQLRPEPGVYLAGVSRGRAATAGRPTWRLGRGDGRSTPRVCKPGGRHRSAGTSTRRPRAGLDLQPVAVPEPGTLALVGLAAGLAGLRLRRKTK